MAAIWTFSGINESSLHADKETGAKTLPIELIVRVFRTYKGNIESGIQGMLSSAIRIQGRMGRTSRASRGHSAPKTIRSIHSTGRESLPMPTRSRSTCLKNLVSEGRPPGSRRAVPRSSTVLRLRPARLLHSPAGRLAAVEFRQGPGQHLDSDGAGDRHWRHVQHVGQCAGRDAVYYLVHHARILPAVLCRRGDRQAGRRRAGRIAVSDRHANEPSLAVARQLWHAI